LGFDELLAEALFHFVNFLPGDAIGYAHVGRGAIDGAGLVNGR
jgi:hypothetical protein